jgi:hypothetical protein
MSRTNRHRRLWNEIHKRMVRDSHGREGVQYVTPEDWLDYNAWLPDDQADRIVALLREHGVQMWLHPDPDGTVRTRMVFEDVNPPSLEMLAELSKYARVLAKAVARSGEWQPPEGNAFGDTPLPEGGHWIWGED